MQRCAQCTERCGSSDCRIHETARPGGNPCFTGRLFLEPGDVVVLYTDGVSDRFTSNDYPSVSHHAPSEVANNIIQRFGKDHDDAACVAVRFVE